MRIGIDISQLAYPNTGVANYLQNLVLSLTQNDGKNDYILFFSSLRRKLPVELEEQLKRDNVKLVKLKFPPTVLHTMWNRFHILPLENFIGRVDFVITSDWTEPPVKNARKATILYDLIIYKYPEETAEKIVRTQRAKLSWVKKECDIIFCISESTKKDAIELLGLPEDKFKVIYPGL